MGNADATGTGVQSDQAELRVIGSTFYLSFPFVLDLACMMTVFSTTFSIDKANSLRLGDV